MSPMVQPGHQSLSASLPPVGSAEPSSSDWQEQSSGDLKIKAITMFEDDERFNDVEPPRNREDLFGSYLVELQKKKAKAAEQRKIHVAEYRAFLESCDFIKANTQWSKVRERLEDDERCFRLEKIDRLNVFQEYTWDLEKEEEKQRRVQKEQTRIQERKNQIERLKKKKLKEAKNDLLYSIKKITATSTWDDDDNQEYRDLGLKAYASELSDKYIICLKERYKEKKKHVREEEKARKEKDREEREKKKYKEKERKGKDRKEKERGREKEREKEKGKGQSKRDEMEIDGDDVEIHGSKDKKREKDKEKKHKRRHHDTADDLGRSERDEKDDSKKSLRHSSDQKHNHASGWILKTGIEDIEGTETVPAKNGLNEELEDGELREEGEIP